MDVFFLDVMLRGASTGIAFITAFLLAIGPVPRNVKLAFAATAFTHTCRQFGAAQLPDGVVDDDFVLILRQIGATASVFLTWFLLCVFGDPRKQLWMWLWILSASVISVGILLVPTIREIVLPLRLYAVVHFCAVLLMIYLGARDDLLERRRIARIAVPSVFVGYAVFLAAFGRPWIPADNAFMLLIPGLFMFVVEVAFVSWVFQVNAEHWIGEVVESPSKDPVTEQRQASTAALIRKIEVAMQDGIWRSEGLTVASLAAEVGAPEHQVRKAINQSMGFRNFSSFINQARIEAAKALLTSPDRATTSVQEIAFEVGFNSIGPFNRAFRDMTGLSPTEFRATQTGQTAAS